MTDSAPPANEPELVAEAVPQPPQLTCPYCGSVDITQGLKLETKEGRVGLEYYPGSGFMGIRAIDCEELYVQLCRRCGTVARMFVHCANRDWRSR